MSIKTKKQEKNINSNSKLEKKKIDKKVFARIKSKFREYWKVLFWLISVYIVVYLVWVSSSKFLVESLRSAGKENWTKESAFLAAFVIIIQGLLFALDGWVTSLLKSPFNQMCYAINKAEGISDKKKDYIITRATESNEHCKETLKKFGILAISGELIRVFIQAANLVDADKYGNYAAYFHISYLIPIAFAGLAILSISRELKKIEKSLKPNNEKQKRSN